jgi:NADH-quinone oxidoreductase subunit L
VGAATLGGLLAWFLYVLRPGLPDRLAASLSSLHRLLLNKYWIDELYDAVIVRPLVRVSDRVLFRGVDAGLIDGVAVNGSARAVRGFAAHGLKYAQSGLTQGYIFFMIAGAAAIVAFLLR